MAGAVQTDVVPCIGDCSRDDAVSVDELLIGIALGDGADIELCSSLDTDQSSTVTVDELLTAIAKALIGCSAP